MGKKNPDHIKVVGLELDPFIQLKHLPTQTLSLFYCITWPDTTIGHNKMLALKTYGVIFHRMTKGWIAEHHQGWMWSVWSMNDSL